MGQTALSMHRMALERVPFSLVVTNPRLPDNPIVFVNEAFCKLTGFTPEASVGRNCRFLQGEDTSETDVDQIRTAIADGDETIVELLNYTADGTPFRNRLHIKPLHDENGEIAYFIGLQRAVGAREAVDKLYGGEDEALREIQHRVKNHLSMVVGLIRMQAKVETANPQENYQTLARRIETLQLLYQEMTGGLENNDQNVPLGAYVSRIAAAIAHIDGRQSVRLNMALDRLTAPVDTAAQIGLLVSEILTNSFQHAFIERADGEISIRLAETDRFVELSIADDGIGFPKDLRWPDNGKLGGKIVRSLLTGLRARLTIENSREMGGTELQINIPRDALRLPQVSPSAADAAQDLAAQ